MAHALGKRQLREDLVAVFLVQVFENVDGVVRIKVADRCGDFVVWDLLDDSFDLFFWCDWIS